MDKLMLLAVPVAIGLCALAAREFPALGSCGSSAAASATADIAGVTRLVIQAGAGDLRVRGVDKAPQIQATGTACASSAELLAQVRIETRREGHTAYVIARLPEIGGGFPWLDNAELDLTVILPDSLPVTVEDGSGDLRISHVRAAQIEDGPGGIEARSITGDLTVADDSGDIDIRWVRGKVWIKQDTSGEIRVMDVQGDVNVDLDGSGALQVESVAASVHIGQDSAGNIDVRDVGRDVRVDSDSSGDIRVVQVGGDFIVEADSTGRVSHDRIEGKVRLPPDRDRNE